MIYNSLKESGQCTCNNRHGVEKNVSNCLLSEINLEKSLGSHLFSRVGGGFALLSDALATTNRLVGFSLILIKTRWDH